MTVPTAVRVGVDLGGTKTRLVLVDRAGEVVASSSRPTADYGTGPAALEALTADIRDLLGPAGADFIGIGASGPVLPDGRIDNPGTLPGFTGLDVAGHLRGRLGITCQIDNDARAAAVGEWAYGAGQGARRLVMVTLGTGIGVAVLDHGSPYTGTDGIAPEAGHIPVSGAGNPCYCGLDNCWEQVASRSVLQRLAQAALPAPVAAAGPAQAVAQLVESPGGAAVFAAYGARVALGLTTLLTVYRPDVVVLGGSGAEQFDLIAPGLWAGLGDRPAHHPPFALRPAALGDLSGAIGAACLSDTQP